MTPGEIREEKYLEDIDDLYTRLKDIYLEEAKWTAPLIVDSKLSNGI